MRPLIDAVPLLGLGRDAIEEKQPLLLLLLHHLSVGKPAAKRDLVELRFGVKLCRGAGAECECGWDCDGREPSAYFDAGNIDATLKFATAGAVTLQLFAAPFTTRAT